jgi:hypothetical protein
MITKITTPETQPKDPLTLSINITLGVEDEDVNIYADNDLIAWFEVRNNKIVLHRSYPVKNRNAFLTDADGYLDVRR